MKKTLSFIFAFVLVIVALSTVVNATSTDKIVEYASRTIEIAGDSFKLPDEDILRIQRYLGQYPVSDEDADKIIAQADKIVNIMKAEGVSNPEKLSKAKKQEIYSVAQEAARIAGTSLTYNSSNQTIVITKDGEKIYEINTDNSKLVQTGNDNTVVYISIAVVAVIAIVTTIVLKKRKVNA